MNRPALSFILCLATLVACGLGCELIASIDRDKIPTAHDGGTAGGGGTGGSGCKSTSDCPAPANECQTATCTAGVCGITFVAPGTKAAAQTAGDCKVKQCDGNGQIVAVNDDTDLPVDGMECTDDVCAAGVPSNPPKAAAKPCGAGGTLFCDGSGKCVGCLMPSDCAKDSECKHPTCMTGVCGATNEPQGKALAAQTAGDCKVAQCDGSGGTEVANLDTDVPVDNETCTGDVCTAGVPSNPPVATSTACTEGTGKLCSAGGKCVECLQPTDCPGTDDECKKRTCSAAGACGVSFTATGTAVTSQTAGDCKKKVCDGAGAVTASADDSDTPDDNNPCTTDTCNAGTPTFTFKAQGTSCGTSLVCDASGHCQGCNTAADCTGVDDECKTRTCISGTCDFSFAASGTAVTSQTPHDCLKNVCNGTGSVVVQNDDADAPVDDGNPCTSDTCSGGVAQHPALPINTGCPAGFCSASATCVACNVATQCSGTDTECQKRTCVTNACGTSFTATGVATPTQTAGDCKENQCDGAGNPLVVNKDTDLPLDDGNPCTGETCTLGVVGHPAQPINTPCNQGAGVYCDGAGACVQCTQGSQCSSMVCSSGHTCSTPTCTDGAKNGNETDVDCGGTCPNKCDGGQGCGVHADCTTGACNPTKMVCAAACMDASSGAGGEVCADYCACMIPTCPGKFTDLTACLDACAVFSDAQICCRGYHCSAAMSDPVTHCPHAAGEALCP